MIDDHALELGLLDVERYIDEADREIAGLSVLALVYVKAIRPLFAPTPGEQQIAEALDFFGPWGAGEVAYSAVCVLCRGRIDDDYQDIAWRIRHRCRELMAAGRVKAKGTKRNRAQRTDAAQFSLFGDLAGEGG